MAKIRKKRNYKRNEDGSIYIAGDSKTITQGSSGSLDSSIKPITITVSNSDCYFNHTDNYCVEYNSPLVKGDLLIREGTLKYSSGPYGLNLNGIRVRTKGADVYSMAFYYNNSSFTFVVTKDDYENQIKPTVGSYEGEIVASGPSFSEAVVLTSCTIIITE